MNTEKYNGNGWSNYETWNYKLWMDNDQGRYNYYSELAGEIVKESADTDYHSASDNAKFTLADNLKQQCEEALKEWMPEQTGPFTDILNSGVSQIDWYEIASSLIEDNI